MLLKFTYYVSLRMKVVCIQVLLVESENKLQQNSKLYKAAIKKLNMQINVNKTNNKTLMMLTEEQIRSIMVHEKNLQPVINWCLRIEDIEGITIFFWMRKKYYHK